MANDDRPLPMRWASQAAVSSTPPGHYDGASQLWSPAEFVREDQSQRAATSMEERILVVTREFDPHADAVIAALALIGIDSLRLNLDAFLSSCSILWNCDTPQGGRITIADNRGRTVCSRPDRIVGYYRGSTPVAPHRRLESRADQLFSASEGEALLESLWGFDDSRWLSSPTVIRRAETKTPQLYLANRLGLRTPRTLITNDPDQAYAFAKALSFDVAVKPLAATTINCECGVFEIFTRRLSRAELEANLDTVRLTPTLFQEYVRKAVELRITIVGDQTFVTEIDSQAVAGAQTDWRQVDPFQLSYRQSTIPVSLEKCLRQFLRHYGLRFGVFDLVVTPDGDYVFLENNPNGQWLWLEVLTGHPIAAGMARLLQAMHREARSAP